MKTSNIIIFILLSLLCLTSYTKLKKSKKTLSFRRDWKKRNKNITRHLYGNTTEKDRFEKCMQRSERVIQILGSKDTRNCLKNTAQVVAIAGSIVAIGISIAGFIVAVA